MPAIADGVCDGLVGLPCAAGGSFERGRAVAAGLALALLHHRSLLLLDEPLAGLHPGEARAMRKPLSELVFEQTWNGVKSLLKHCYTSCARPRPVLK